MYLNNHIRLMGQTNVPAGVVGLAATTLPYPATPS